MTEKVKLKVKTWLRVIVLLGIVVILGYRYYNNGLADLTKAKADFTISAEILFSEFSKNENYANEMYLDKVLEVKGEIQNINIDSDDILNITLKGDEMFGVICQLDPEKKYAVNGFEKGEYVSLKGMCTGMLMDVVLVRCVKSAQEK